MESQKENKRSFASILPFPSNAILVQLPLQRQAFPVYSLMAKLQDLTNSIWRHQK